MSHPQNAFIEALLAPDAPVPVGLSDPEGRPAGKRFDVYRNNVAVSLTEALLTAFPAVAKLLGDENFRAVASVFLRQHPPQSPLLMFYGEEMPEFLEQFPPVQKWGYLPDVARLELALRRSYHAEDAPALDPKHLQSLDPEALVAARLRLAPAARLVRSRWPVVGLWQFNMLDDAEKPVARAEDALVVRPEFDPEVHLLPPGGGVFVSAVSGGATVGDAYDASLRDTPDFDLIPTLGLLLSTGALTALEPEK